MGGGEEADVEGKGDRTGNDCLSSLRLDGWGVRLRPSSPCAGGVAVQLGAWLALRAGCALGLPLGS